MTPEETDMRLRVVPGDVSGYYEEKILNEHPDYWRGLYSLTSTPWRVWLGMELDEKTLQNMSVVDIIGNCIYEMTWCGYDEDARHKNHEELLEKEGDGDGEVADAEVDVKTECENFIRSFVPVVLPGIISKIDTPEFEQELKDVNCKENGALCVPYDLKPFDLPLTGFGFFYIYIDGKCMMGVSAEIEGQYVGIEYQWLESSMKELKAVVDTEESKNFIVDTLCNQVENYFE